VPDRKGTTAQISTTGSPWSSGTSPKCLDFQNLIMAPALRCSLAEEEGMTVRNVWIVLAGALWLGVLGVIGSVALDRPRFDTRRPVIVAQLVAAIDDVSAEVATPIEASWEQPVRAVDEALAQGDRGSAERAWEGLAAAGDAALRMGETSRAREAFLATLSQARKQSSFAGVLRAEEAFETLGDRALALRCLSVAEKMPGIGDIERGLVRERFERLAASARAAGGAR